MGPAPAKGRQPPASGKDRPGVSGKGHHLSTSRTDRPPSASGKDQSGVGMGPAPAKGWQPPASGKDRPGVSGKGHHLSTSRTDRPPSASGKDQSGVGRAPAPGKGRARKTTAEAGQTTSRSGAGAYRRGRRPGILAGGDRPSLRRAAGGGGGAGVIVAAGGTTDGGAIGMGGRDCPGGPPTRAVLVGGRGWRGQRQSGKGGVERIHNKVRWLEHLYLQATSRGWLSRVYPAGRSSVRRLSRRTRPRGGWERRSCTGAESWDTSRHGLRRRTATSGARSPGGVKTKRSGNGRLCWWP